MTDKESDFFSIVPTQMVNDDGFVSAPVISSSGKSFKGKTSIGLTADSNCTIYYTLDQTLPHEKSMKYSAPVVLDRTATVRAMAIDQKGNKSSSTTATL